MLSAFIYDTSSLQDRLMQLSITDMDAKVCVTPANSQLVDGNTMKTARN